MTKRATTKIVIGSGKTDGASIPASYTDPAAVPNLVAQHMSRDMGLDAQSIVDQIVEVTPETQTAGPALLQVQVIDPQWVIQRALPLDEDGFLPIVDVNYPEGSPVWWRLAMVDGGSDITQANLTLTFQHRAWHYLTSCSGPLTWPAGKPGSTRAQFAKMVIDKMPSELPSTAVGAMGRNGLGGPDDFVFVCPDLNVVQPVAASSAAGQTVLLDTSQAAAAVNKVPALTKATDITIKGAKATATQISAANIAMTTAGQLKASPLAALALIEACIDESTMGADMVAKDGSGSLGILQLLPSTAQGLGVDPRNIADCVKLFLTKGFTGAGGAIELATKNPTWTAAKIATTVQGNRDGESVYAAFLVEATAIVDGHGALLGATGSSTTTGESDVSQLARGSADDPDEDSASCIQRLASEVNWRCYTNPQPHPGYWGNYIYFIDDTTMVKAQPALYVKLDDSGDFWTVSNESGSFLGTDGQSMISALTHTVDDTSVQSEVLNTVKAKVGKGKKSKVARRTAVRKPQTPTQIQCNLITGGLGILGFNAGLVAVFQNTGILDGRWILENNTCNSLGDLFQQLTFGPAEFAYPEPQASASAASAAPPGAASPGSVGITQGQLQGVADAALKAAAIQKKKPSAYNYAEIGGEPVPASLFSDSTLTLDCSLFAETCFKEAGLPDPNGFKYKRRGNTQSLIANCKQVSKDLAGPGDMLFWGSSLGMTSHVNVYVGNGRAVNMGSQGEPREGAAESLGPPGVPFLGYWRSNVAPKAVAAVGVSGTHSVLPSSGYANPFTSPWAGAGVGGVGTG